MPSLNPEYIEAVRELIHGSPYFQLIGMRMEELDQGRVVFRMEVETKHLQPFHLAHGGVLASILDAACFWSVFGSLDQALSLTTADLAVKYLAPVPEKARLEVIGKQIKIGSTLTLSEAEATDLVSGKLVAHGTSTCVVLKTPPPPEFGHLPKKFI